ncbi:TRAP transporter permease DctQ [Bordetella genomosp. 1]|uniref:TRAP transporter small permease protein n=1 Tax=Bordetella genomosp. 1 TaxID=1395607 RepID=A0A261RUD3_9BORD|nr:TRAP transporter small permease [Bordetella genomosp. 1]OZI28688.1 TRAP transporter permease DctQ [Bordetella genomosp. 1]OZI55745.1 TRAP transporter permease DctQ [Bordetella genomosp. 1]
MYSNAKTAGLPGHEPMRASAAAEPAPQGPAHQPASVSEIVQSFEEADEHQRVDLSGYHFEDWLCLALFWAMGGLVFLQFFSRYVMNDSFAWTEELAVYALIGVVFLGAAMCVRACRHIQVDFLYRYLPRPLGRLFSTLVDLIRTAFFGYAVWLVYRYITLVGDEPMTTLFWNKAYVYWVALAGFVMMFVRSVQVSVQNWRQGYSILENPSAYESLD